jgi:hypothetical protein
MAFDPTSVRTGGSGGRPLAPDRVQEWVFHDRNHIRQLLANAQARIWPAMGGTRRFTDPNA